MQNEHNEIEDISVEMGIHGLNWFLRHPDRIYKVCQLAAKHNMRVIAEPFKNGRLRFSAKG